LTKFKKEWDELRHQFAIKILHELIYPILETEKHNANKKNAYLRISPNQYSDEYYYFQIGPVIYTNKKLIKRSDFGELEFDEDSSFSDELSLPELKDFSFGDEYGNDDMSTIFFNFQNGESGAIFGVEEHNGKNIWVNYN